MSNDPVFEADYVWWFWDETWSFLHGPYPTEESAREACIEYARKLDE